MSTTRPTTFLDNKKLTVINLFSGPGVGKSTTAAATFAKMKKRGYKVELVHEAAKDFVWERWGHIFGEQDYIFAHQHRMIRRLVMHDVDYAIVDSSILLGLFYTPADFPPSFKQFVEDVFSSYNNINIILERNQAFQYQQTGRNETHQQAINKDQQILDYFVSHNIPHHVVVAGDAAEDIIIQIVNDHKSVDG